MFLAFALVLIPLGRACVRTWVLPSVLRPRRALIVGAGLEGRVVQKKLEAHPEFGLQVIGFVDAERGPSVLGDARRPPAPDRHARGRLGRAWPRAPSPRARCST